ncbi:MAG: hypothetical protein R3F61_19140 [Myxococcota bacterium]
MSDPTHGSPFAARPWSVIAWSAVMYALVVCGPAASMWVSESDEGGEVMAAWAVLGGGFCLPVGLLAGLVAASRERLITRLDRPARFAWIGYGIGAMGLGHWLPMSPYPVVAIVLGFSSSGHWAEKYFESAAWGLLAWVSVALSIVVILATRAGFSKRTGAVSSVHLPEIPHLVPSSALAALLVGPLMFVSTLLVAQGGDGAGNAIPMIFVFGGLGSFAALGFAWSGAAGETEGALRGGPQVSWGLAFASYLAAFLGVQWSVAFAMTLLPAWGQALGQRFILQIACVAVLTVAAGVLGRRLATVERSTQTG